MLWRSRRTETSDSVRELVYTPSRSIRQVILVPISSIPCSFWFSLIVHNVQRKLMTRPIKVVCRWVENSITELLPGTHERQLWLVSIGIADEGLRKTKVVNHQSWCPMISLGHEAADSSHFLMPTCFKSLTALTCGTCRIGLSLCLGDYFFKCSVSQYVLSSTQRSFSCLWRFYLSGRYTCKYSAVSSSLQWKTYMWLSVR